jgi:hypothetical protein
MERRHRRLHPGPSRHVPRHGRMRTPLAAHTRIALNCLERPDRYITARQSALRCLVTEWGGWGSYLRPADHEFSMLANAQSGRYLRKRKTDHCYRPAT